MSARPYEPTARRLREARSEGRVARSPALTGAVSLATAGACLFFLAPFGWEVLRSFAGAVWLGAGMAHAPSDVIWVLGSGMGVLALLATPVAVAAVAGAVLGGLLQVGPLWAPRAVSPDGERLAPRGFDGPGLLTGLVLAAALLLVGADALLDAAGLARAAWAPQEAAALLFAALWQLALKLVLVCIAVGGIEYLWRRHRLRHELRMTRAQWVRAQREEAGDPGIRRERHRLRRQDADPVASASLSDGELVLVGDGVVVIGRRHGETVPRVLAAGRGLQGDRLLADARASGIAVAQEADACWACWSAGPGRYVPRGVFDVVARHLASGG